MLPLPQMQSAIPLLLLFFFFSSSTIVWYKDRLNWTIAPCFGVERVDIHSPHLTPTHFRFDFRVRSRLGDNKSADHPPPRDVRPGLGRGRAVSAHFHGKNAKKQSFSSRPENGSHRIVSSHLNKSFI